MTHAYTRRDLAWIEVVEMESDEEFQVHHIAELIEHNYPERTVSDNTIRAVLRTMVDTELLRRTDDGKWFVRNF